MGECYQYICIRWEGKISSLEFMYRDLRKKTWSLLYSVLENIYLDVLLMNVCWVWLDHIYLGLLWLLPRYLTSCIYELTNVGIHASAFLKNHLNWVWERDQCTHDISSETRCSITCEVQTHWSPPCQTPIELGTMIKRRVKESKEVQV